MYLIFYLWSNYNQTWHDGALGQNLSKSIEILLMSSPGGKYDHQAVFGIIPVSFIVCLMELKFDFKFKPKNPLSISFKGEKRPFLMKN